MLEMFGVTVKREGTKGSLENFPEELTAPTEIEVPGDISSAAFWMVAGSIIPESDLLLKNVGLNPTRTGILDALLAMGADIQYENERMSGAEAVADLRVRYAKLRGITLAKQDIPRLIDEIPILVVAAMCAEGQTIIRGAEELRVKETDRIQAVCAEFTKLGAVIEEKQDGMIITGSTAWKYAKCASYDDHRIAMALAIAGAAGQGVSIINPECVNISYPTFYETLGAIRVKDKKKVIAIDGPAGAGKSTIAKLIAKKIGYIYVDTGAMYRAVAWKALQNNTTDSSEIEAISQSIRIKLAYTKDGLQVWADDTDVTEVIRTPEVTRLVSTVATLPEVRHSMLLLQRDMAKEGGVIMDGRDIGTHVLPNADLKIFLTASIEERAQRRYLELEAKGYEVDLETLKTEIANRDKMDMEREIAPLVQADDAILLDTTSLSIEEVVEKILSYK